MMLNSKELNGHPNGGTMASFPKKSSNSILNSYFRLILLTSVACGLEFCACASFVFIPSLLMEHDIDGYELSFILSLAPLIAVVTTPFIGKMSDDCHSKSGGRKPFIVTLSLGVFTSLLLLGSYQDLSVTLSRLMTVTAADEVTDVTTAVSSDKIAKLLLILGIIGLDYCSQVCLNPFESLLSDIYKNTKWAELSYAIYSSMLALGSCVGYLIIALDWNVMNVSYLNIYFFANEKATANSETVIFYFLAILFVLSLLATMYSLSDGPTPGPLGNQSNHRFDKSSTNTGPTDKMNAWRERFSPDSLETLSITSSETADPAIVVQSSGGSSGDDDGYDSTNTNINNNNNLSTERYSDYNLLNMVFEDSSHMCSGLIPTYNSTCSDHSCMQLYNEKELSTKIPLLNGLNSNHNINQKLNSCCSGSNYSRNPETNNHNIIYKTVSNLYQNCVCHWPLKRVLLLFLKFRNSFRFLRIWLKWPVLLKKLFWVHLFMWTSLMIHNLFYADYMGRYIFQGDPKRETGHPLRVAYDAGIRSASWGLLYHSLLGAIAAPLIERFLISTQAMTIKTLYTLSLYLFDFVMFALIIVPEGSPGVCNFVTTLTGITLAVVNSVPFILLSKYHANKSKFYFDCQSSSPASPPRSIVKALADGLKPGQASKQSNPYTYINCLEGSKDSANSRFSKETPFQMFKTTTSGMDRRDTRKNFGIGSDIAVLDIGYFLAQIIASILIGQIIKLTPDPRYYMFSALAISSFGCFFAKHVIASESELFEYQSQQKPVTRAPVDKTKTRGIFVN